MKIRFTKDVSLLIVRGVQERGSLEQDIQQFFRDQEVDCFTESNEDGSFNLNISGHGLADNVRADCFQILSLKA